MGVDGRRGRERYDGFIRCLCYKIIWNGGQVGMLFQVAKDIVRMLPGVYGICTCNRTTKKEACAI